MSHAFPNNLSLLPVDIMWIPCISADSECGPVGFGGLIVTLFGCLWTWLFWPPVLWRPVCSELWHQQRKEHSAGWVSSGPYGLSLRQVLLIEEAEFKIYVISFFSLVESRDCVSKCCRTWFKFFASLFTSLATFDVSKKRFSQWSMSVNHQITARIKTLATSSLAALWWFNHASNVVQNKIF